MQTTRFTWFPGLALAVLFTLLAGSAGADDRHLEGTWNVTLRFPVCSSQCPCPGGTPNIPIPALHLYLKHGSFMEVSGGSPLRSPGLGSWERIGPHQFEARFKFFLFNPDGSRRGSEEITNHIELTGPDAFEANATFDLFDAAGNMTGQGCAINESAARFQ